MTLRTPVLLAAVATLVACVKPVEVTQKPATLALKNPRFAERVVGYREPVLRSYTKVDGKRQEVAGLRCEIDSAELKASVVTPIVLRTPTFTGKPTALRIACKGSTLEGSKVIEPTLSGVVVGGASAAGLVAAMVSTAVVASRDQWNFAADGAALAVEVE